MITPNVLEVANENEAGNYQKKDAGKRTRTSTGLRPLETVATLDSACISIFGRHILGTDESAETIYEKEVNGSNYEAENG
jgi:hypothetical protein